MKTINFHKLSLIKTAFFLGLAVACLFISFFEVIAPENSLTNRILNFLGYIIISIHFAKSLWYKYYVSYNKKGLTIRLNRNILQERTFMYKHLKDVVLEKTTISFQYRKNLESIELEGFNLDDINKVHHLLNSKK
ncbi:hypothetical protein [Aurantibacter sp.]|uniref:hypothetical protein n=1 Tax=Aurantibacter sp. TaxID=2807103 RepID=UPI0035C86D83